MVLGGRCLQTPVKRPLDARYSEYSAWLETLGLLGPQHYLDLARDGAQINGKLMYKVGTQTLPISPK